MLPVANDSCTESTCPGRTAFFYTKSTSWTDAGVYEIPLPYFFTDNMLNNGLQGIWGKDVVYLGNSARDVPSENYVVGISSLDLSLATFGLAAGEIGGLESALPTLLTDIRGKGDIPSLSFSYTAGSVARKDMVFVNIRASAYFTRQFFREPRPWRIRYIPI